MRSHWKCSVMKHVQCKVLATQNSKTIPIISVLGMSMLPLMFVRVVNCFHSMCRLVQPCNFFSYMRISSFVNVLHIFSLCKDTVLPVKHWALWSIMLVCIMYGTPGSLAIAIFKAQGKPKRRYFIFNVISSSVSL